jgi:YVTN family beta-propeller protein
MADIESVGDAMMMNQLLQRYLAVAGGILLCVAAMVFALAAEPKVRIIQTNSAGDNVHIIDPVTNTVVGVITGIEVNHGAAVAPDGSRIYISDEAESTLDVVDGKTLKVTHRIPLSGHPNNIAVSRDGRRVYVGIIQAPGGVDVIDTASLKDVKTLQTKGSIHNPYVTPDGKYVVAGSIQGKSINVFDTQTEQPAWTLEMDLGIRPMTFSTNADGSTKWLFVQLTGFNGFAVVDFATRKEINRIKNPDLPPGKKTVPAGSDPSHGMAVTADGKTLVVCSRLNNFLYAYSLPDLKSLGGAELGGMGAGWVTLTPDGKTAYVANPVTNDVSVVDIKSLKEEKHDRSPAVNSDFRIQISDWIADRTVNLKSELLNLKSIRPRDPPETPAGPGRRGRRSPLRAAAHTPSSLQAATDNRARAAPRRSLNRPS